MKAQVSGNSIEFSLSASDALLVGLSVLMVVALAVLAGWQVAFVALGVSLLGAGAVDAVQRSDIRIFDR